MHDERAADVGVPRDAVDRRVFTIRYYRFRNVFGNVVVVVVNTYDFTTTTVVGVLLSCVAASCCGRGPNWKFRRVSKFVIRLGCKIQKTGLIDQFGRALKNEWSRLLFLGIGNIEIV